MIDCIEMKIAFFTEIKIKSIGEHIEIEQKINNISIL